MVEFTIYLILFLYFFFCVKYALMDLLGARTNGDVFERNGALCYGFTDKNGNYIVARGNLYLSQCKEAGEEDITVLYLPAFPRVNIVAGWLGVRFKQLALLGVVFLVMGGGVYGLSEQWPQIQRYVSSLHIQSPVTYMVNKALETPSGLPEMKPVEGTIKIDPDWLARDEAQRKEALERAKNFRASPPRPLYVPQAPLPPTVPR